MAVREPRSAAWIRMVGLREAEGPLRELYAAMKAGGGARPAVYEPPTGDVANIVRCHGLDPEGLRLAFAVSGAVSWSPLSLEWAEREMLNTVTSAANNCFY